MSPDAGGTPPGSESHAAWVALVGDVLREVGKIARSWALPALALALILRVLWRSTGDEALIIICDALPDDDDLGRLARACAGYVDVEAEKS